MSPTSRTQHVVKGSSRFLRQGFSCWEFHVNIVYGDRDIVVFQRTDFCAHSSNASPTQQSLRIMEPRKRKRKRKQQCPASRSRNDANLDEQARRGGQTRSSSSTSGPNRSSGEGWFELKAKPKQTKQKDDHQPFCGTHKERRRWPCRAPRAPSLPPSGCPRRWGWYPATPRKLQTAPRTAQRHKKQTKNGQQPTRLTSQARPRLCDADAPFV